MTSPLTSSRSFAPPAPGTWKQDGAHSPRPVTTWKYETFQEPFVRGFREGTARYGLLLDHLEPAVVNGFLYYRDNVVSDGAEVGRRFDSAKQAFEGRVWRDDLARWDRDIKPDSIRRNRDLENTPLRDLDTEALIRHLDAVRDNTAEMVYRHHMFSVASVIPVGHYMAQAMEWTGLDAGTVLAPLKGSSKVSLGVHDELIAVGARLREAGIDLSNSQGAEAAATLDALRSRGDALGAAVRAYLDAVGMRLASGYDICDPCAIELPQLLLGAIAASREATGRAGANGATAKVREGVPAEHRAAFDELLGEARLVNRLRDERGVFNDVWAVGIARQAFLEAGRRLVLAGRLEDGELVIDATHAELVAALRGSGAVPAAVWQERAAWRRDASLDAVPPFLGEPPSAPPPLDGLPPHAQIAMRAIGTALNELFVPGQPSQGTTITGKPVSPGLYTGRARVIVHSSDTSRLQQGDVLVTATTSPAFNIVLPLLGAIVTDRGGQLSHAAIVAREYGIPAVVGTLRATATIPDGARVEVDGSKGLVRLL